MRQSDGTGAQDGTGRGDGRFRDDELGGHLRALEVPDRAPDFFALLEERLEEGPSAKTGPAGARRRRPSTEGRGRSWLRLMWIPIPAAMVILALLWAFAGPLGIESFKPEIASAAEITAKALAAVEEAESFRGTLVVVIRPLLDGGLESYPGQGGPWETRYSYVETARGDFRIAGSTGDGLYADVCYE